MKVKKQRIIFGYIILDLFLLLVSTLSVLFLPYLLELSESTPVSSRRALFLVSVFSVGWIITIFVNSAQDFYMKTKLTKRNKALIINCLLFIGIATTLILTFDLRGHLIRLTYLVIGTFFVLNLVSFKVLIDIFKKGKFFNNLEPECWCLGLEKRDVKFSIL